MREIHTDELKRIQIGILDDVALFCKQHNLRYYLAYGTLLGAVRHKGYIPWDDDIDIHMPRPDYEKFLATYNADGKDNIAVAPELDARYRLPFAKVYRKGTVVKENHFKPDLFGVYIDIFPLDGYADKKQAYECGEMRRYMHVKNSVFLHEMSPIRKLRLAVTKLILLPFNLKGMLARIKTLVTKQEFDSSEYVFSSYSRLAVKEVFHHSVFDRYKIVIFEGKEYRAPVDCDSYLKALYGNYMALPPEDKRISTHNSRAWSLEDN